MFLPVFIVSYLVPAGKVCGRAMNPVWLAVVSRVPFWSN
jgi:hypothetical protein